MNRALKESRRRQKADEEVATSLQKVQLLVTNPNSSSSQFQLETFFDSGPCILGERARAAVPGGGEEEGGARSSPGESRKGNFRATTGNPAGHDRGGIRGGDGDDIGPGTTKHDQGRTGGGALALPVSVPEEAGRVVSVVGHHTMVASCRRRRVHLRSRRGRVLLARRDAVAQPLARPSFALRATVQEYLTRQQQQRCPFP